MCLWGQARLGTGAHILCRTPPYIEGTRYRRTTCNRGKPRCVHQNGVYVRGSRHRPQLGNHLAINAGFLIQRGKERIGLVGLLLL